MIRVGVSVGSFSASGGGASFDADAQAFFDRVTTAGGSLTTTEKNATNQLVLDMKSAGIWTSMKAVYPMVGASAAACAQNLKSSSFTGTFTSGWTFASTGVTPNGTSAYCDTNVVLQTTIFGKDYSFGYYSRTNNDGVFGDIGNFYSIGSSVNALSTYTRLNNKFYLDSPNETVRTVVANVDSLGFYASNNSSSVGKNLYKNNTKIINTAFSNNDFPVQLNPNVAFGASYIGNIGGARFSSRQLAFVYFGSALTDTQTVNFYTAVQTFNTTLSRAIAP
jgi:hypothetical protein